MPVPQPVQKPVEKKILPPIIPPSPVIFKPLPPLIKEPKKEKSKVEKAALSIINEEEDTVLEEKF